METQSAPRSSIASVALSPPRDWHATAGAIGGIAAHGPLVISHFAQILAKPHFQFIVCLPVAIALLGWLRMSEQPAKKRVPAMAGPLVLVIGVTVLLMASVLYSPWLGTAALWINVGGWLLWNGGWANVPRWFAPWLVCVAALGLPFGWDQTVILQLKDVSTLLASGLLDQFGVLHLRSGNVIDVPGRQMFVAEACSGIHSFFVTLTFALCYALWMHRRFIHTVLLIGIAALIVLVENSTRLVAVVTAASQGNDLLEPTRHTILGFLLFGAALGLVISADRMLRFLIPTETEDESADRQADRTATMSHQPSWRARWWIPLLLLPLVVVQWSQMPSDAAGGRGTSVTLLEMPEFGAQLLPQNIAGLTQVAYRVEKREPGNPFGLNSQIWAYRRGDTEVEITFDYPYDSLHDTCLCYLNTGWSLEQQKMLPAVTDDAGSDAEVGLAYIKQSLVGNAWVWFSGIDEVGQPKVRLHGPKTEGLTKSFRERFAAHERPDSRRYFQVQLLARNPLGELTEEELELYSQVYRQARRRIVAAVLSRKESSP